MADIIIFQQHPRAPRQRTFFDRVVNIGLSPAMRQEADLKARIRMHFLNMIGDVVAHPEMGTPMAESLIRDMQYLIECKKRP